MWCTPRCTAVVFTGVRLHRSSDKECGWSPRSLWSAPRQATKSTRVRTNKNNKNCAIIKSAAHKEQKNTRAAQINHATLQTRDPPRVVGWLAQLRNTGVENTNISKKILNI